MILINTNFNDNFKKLISEAITKKDNHKLLKFINNPTNSFLDIFLPILEDHKFNKDLFKISGFNDFDDWLFKIDKWQMKMLDPGSSSSIQDLILYSLWEKFTKILKGLLREARLKANIPTKGGLLVFIGGLSKCLVINYEMVNGTPKFNIVAILQNPKSVFDFWDAIEQVDMAARNHLKTILSSGHKIIIHRGVLNHIDKREDNNVFGPSIDTLVLAEILAQRVFEQKQYKYRTAIDIGCGNGLLTAALANHCVTLNEVFAIDINFNSISCTKRNYYRNDLQSLSPCFINSPFSAYLINRKFDLVVCNPPYIPNMPNTVKAKNGALDYLQAVSGTELMKYILTSTKKILKPGGKMFLMASSLSIDKTLSWISNDYNVSQPLGKKGVEVLFDVESVLNNKDWLKFLQDKHGLKCRKGFYYHILHPIEVELL